MAKRKNPVFLYKGQREGGVEEPKEEQRGKNLVFTYSKERSGKVKGYSVNVISIYLSLTINFSRFLSFLFLCLFLEIAPMGVE